MVKNNCVARCVARWAVWLFVSFCAFPAMAQPSLAGRVYHNPNILAPELNKLAKELDVKKDSMRAAALAKAAEKKGRALTAEETAELDKKMAEAKKMVEAVKKGSKTALTIEFKNESKLVMKADMKISEEALKAAGIGWMKRKALKAALALAPSSQKATYVVEGDLVIIDDGEEQDTLQLSADGKRLSGKFDKKTRFTLTRTK